MHESRTSEPSPLDVEAIVRAVLRRLRDVGAGTVPGFASGAMERDGAMDGGPVLDPDDVPSGSLRWERPLVTLGDIEGRLEGVAELCVARRAVVTPAVRDELRRRGIPLRRLDPWTPAHQGESAGLLVIAPTAQADDLRRRQGEARLAIVDEPGDPVRGAAVVAEHFAGGGRLACWLSHHPFAAQRAVRECAGAVAVQLHRIEDLRRAMAEADPNTLILDAPSWASHAVGQLARTWLERGTR